MLSEDLGNHATSPMASGGHGIRQASDVAFPAYLPSVAGSHAFITQLLPQRLHSMPAQIIRNLQPCWLIGSFV